MRKTLILSSAICFFFNFSHAQFSGLLNKAKQAVEKPKESPNNNNSNNNNSSNANTGNASGTNSPAAGSAGATDEGITSPLHGKYNGKLLFTTKLLGRDATTESSFINEVTLGELLAARVYSVKSLVNTLMSDFPAEEENTFVLFGRPLFRFSIDNVKVYEFAYSEDTWTGGDKKRKTTFGMEFVSEAGRTANDGKIWGQFIKEAASKLTPGVHTLKLEYYAAVQDIMKNKPLTTGSLMSSGEIKVNVTKAVDVVSMMINDDNFSTKCWKRQAEIIEPSLKETVINFMNTQKTWDGNPILKKNIFWSKWEVTRNEITGRPLGRRCEINYVFKNKEGVCKTVKENFYFEHDGDSYSTIPNRKPGDPITVPCECLEYAKRKGW